jgi:hypothetical protein
LTAEADRRDRIPIDFQLTRFGRCPCLDLTLSQRESDRLGNSGRSGAEKIVVWDACLSFLSIFMEVERDREIRIRYQKRTGGGGKIHAGEEGKLSELLQQVIDHLDGILAVDRMTDIRTLCTRVEFEKRYRATSPYAVTPAAPA